MAVVNAIGLSLQENILLQQFQFRHLTSFRIEAKASNVCTTNFITNRETVKDTRILSNFTDIFGTCRPLKKGHAPCFLMTKSHHIEKLHGLFLKS